MNRQEIGKLVEGTIDLLKKEAPTILTGIGVVTEIGAIASTVTGTMKASKILDEEKPEGKVQTAKAVWKCYINSVILTGVSIGCFIGSNSMNSHRYLALLGAYKLSEGQMSEYRKKVIDLIGKDEEKEIRKKAAEEHIKHAGRPAIIPSSGPQIVYDEMTGRYFRSSTQDLYKAVNKLGRLLICENRVSLNTFYDELGLEPIELGDTLVWDVEQDDVPSLEIFGHLMEDGTPCLSMSIEPKPRHRW